MLGYTTLALAAKLQAEIDIDFGRKVAICSGENLKGKVKSKEVNSLDLPAMALMRTSAVINRSRIPRGTVGRYGMAIKREHGLDIILRIIPVTTTYSITILTPDTEATEKVTSSLIWMYATPGKMLLPIKMNVSGEDQILDVLISDESAFANNIASIKQEEWDGGIMFTSEFDLTVHSYVMDTATRKLITSIDLSFRSTDGTVIESVDIPEVV